MGFPPRRRPRSSSPSSPRRPPPRRRGVVVVPWRAGERRRLGARPSAGGGRRGAAGVARARPRRRPARSSARSPRRMPSLSGARDPWETRVQVWAPVPPRSNSSTCNQVFPSYEGTKFKSYKLPGSLTFRPIVSCVTAELQWGAHDGSSVTDDRDTTPQSTKYSSTSPGSVDLGRF